MVGPCPSFIPTNRLRPPELCAPPNWPEVALTDWRFPFRHMQGARKCSPLHRFPIYFRPHSIEAEQALLGAILNNQDALFAVDGIITRDDFYEPLHGKLFARFVETRDAGGRINLGLVSATLGEFGKLPVGNLSVSQYVARLAAEATTVINAPDYARIIREVADKRRLIDLGETLLGIVSGDQSAVTVAIDAIDALDGIISSRPGAVVSRVGIGDAAIAAVDRMIYAMQNPNGITGVTWGLHDLDALTGGLQRGDLVVIAGRPGMGKTGFAVSSASAAPRERETVFYFSRWK